MERRSSCCQLCKRWHSFDLEINIVQFSSYSGRERNCLAFANRYLSFYFRVKSNEFEYMIFDSVLWSYGCAANIPAVTEAHYSYTTLPRKKAVIASLQIAGRIHLVKNYHSKFIYSVAVIYRSFD